MSALHLVSPDPDTPNKAPKRAYKPRKAKLEASPQATQENLPKARKTALLGKAQKRNIGQGLAAFAAGFLPVASYVLAHYEAKQAPMLWALVAAGLAYSAPTLAQWAKDWTKSSLKAWGFCILLEGVMCASNIPALSVTALVILCGINMHAAWEAYARKG